MTDWGYEDILPQNRPPVFTISHPAHFVIGIIICAAGVTGGAFTVSLLQVHRKLKESLLDSSGILLCNFLIANLLLAALQCPFSGVSALAGGWLFGDFGCQLYAFIGFHIGIGLIFSLGILVMDGYQLAQEPAFLPGSTNRSWIMLTVSWHLVFLFTAPPLLGVFGRYGLEPSGASCTIDYWHGNFRSYNKYILYVMVFAYLIPVSLMILMILKTFRKFNARKVKLNQKNHQANHFLSMSKVCALLFIVQIVCWTPYAVLILWTLIFPPQSLNVYLTLVPSLSCKFSPLLNCWIVWKNIPRISAGYFYLKKGGRGPLPKELCSYEMEEKEPLAK